MASPPWDTIPLLALKCIIEHLEEKDALAATSTCRHWRSSLLIYEGHRDVLTLPAINLEKCDYLARLFKKHTRRLHIQIDGRISEELDSFMYYILPQFLDSINLQGIVFIGPLYTNLSRTLPYAHLRRIITETLVYKHAHVLETFAVFACELKIIDENDRFVNSKIDYFSKPLSFQLAQPFAQSIRENTVLSRSIVDMMMFSNLKHIVFEYELLSTEALVTLSKLDNFQLLSLNFTSKKGLTLPRLDWDAVTPLFRKGLEVAVNLIYLSGGRLQKVLDNALCAEMPVTSIKALFLSDFFMELIMHVTRNYGSQLTEFVWADPPTLMNSCRRAIPIEYPDAQQTSYSKMNPFIFLSWRCTRLQKLVIHGYWICEYDLLGITRLRAGLDLIVSSIYDSTSPLFEYPSSVHGGNLLRVMSTDIAPTVIIPNKGMYMSHLNEVQTRQLTPKNWTDLPDALKLGATSAQRSDYIVSEVLNPWGIT